MQSRDLASRPKSGLSRALVERQEEHPQHDASYQMDPLARRIGSIGDPGSANAHAAVLNRANAAPTTQASAQVLQMQRHYGNRHVQRVMAIARQSAGGGEVPGDVERSIQQSRGGGQSLSSSTRAQMEPALGANFSNVRVHTGSQADALNRSLGARAFTTGRDMFFRQGEYNPGNSRGQELLAHELTHVVQQGGSGVQGKLTVSQPGDVYEREADQVASAVMQRKQIARKSPEEEQEMMGMKRLPGVDANVFR